MKDKDLVSIIIPSFNAKKYLKSCLDSILKSNYLNYEVIVVDNGSTDATTSFINQKYAGQDKRIKVLVLNKNYGPATARNEGVRIAKGKYLAFLDSDTQVHPDWTKEGIKLFNQDKKIGAIQCKLLLMTDKKKIDYVGEYLSSLGFLVPLAEYGQVDDGQYDSTDKILAAKSAGMFISKKVFEETGGFDDDYFIFMEETDLGWRCWLKGYQVVFCPSSIVYHHFSASKEIFDKETNNKLIRFHGTKNYLLTLFKNLSLSNLIKVYPLNVLLWIGLAGYLLIRGKLLSSFNIFKGVVWNFVYLPVNLTKRIKIQKQRILTDAQLFDQYQLMRKKSFWFFVQKFLASQKEVVTTES